MIAARVLCASTEIGTARFESTEGIAWALLVPGPAYEMIRGAAHAIGEFLGGTRFWAERERDFASAVADHWLAPPLALADDVGRQIIAVSVVVAHAQHPSGHYLPRWVIADFRAPAAPRPALIRFPPGDDDGTNTRPAA